MIIHFDEITPAQRYFAMAQSIIPRPIAWVLSDSGNQAFNIAPFSFFSGICSDPPLIMISAGQKPNGREVGLEKDTRRNIRERKKFVVHIASADFLEPLNASAATLDHCHSELDEYQIETESFEGFNLPRVKNIPVAMGCELYRMDEIGNAPQAVIYGQIKTLYLADEIAGQVDGRLTVDPHKFNPLAKLGGHYYSLLGQTLSVARPK